MNGKRSTITRRGFIGGALALAGSAARRSRRALPGSARARMDLRRSCPAGRFAFPADHGPHPEFRIEWWYVTANLADASGAAYGAQWTLFRQAIAAGRPAGGLGQPADLDGPCRRHPRRYPSLYPGVRARRHRPRPASTQNRFAPGSMPGRCAGSIRVNDDNIAPLRAEQRQAPISATRCASTHERPLVLQGDGGYSRKSLREQASYYYSQPHYTAKGVLTIDDKPVDVTGLAWLDREWSSQPLASDQSGWDWLSLHFDAGDKLMLYRMRQADGQHYGSGKWIAPDGNGRTARLRQTSR